MLEGRGGEADRQECDEYVKLSETVSRFRGEVRDWIAGRAAPSAPVESKPSAESAKPPPGKAETPPEKAKPAAGDAKPPDIEGDGTAEPSKKKKG